MSRPIDVDDVLRPQPTPSQLLWRGLVKHCPRCGSGHIYETWFRMKERCPTCGYLFEREPGFFVGAYLINFAIVEGFLFVMLMGFIAWKSQNPDAGMVLAIVLGLSIGLVGPVVFYPFARTIWSALDLLMTPMEMDEIVAAADAVTEPLPADGRADLPDTSNGVDGTAGEEPSPPHDDGSTAGGPPAGAGPPT